MTTITVGQLAPVGCWDVNMLDLLFANQLWDTGLEFKKVTGYPNGVDGCVMVIPGRYWHARCNEISEAISRYEWVLAIRTSDEEDVFDPYKVWHSNVKWWVQTPKVGHDYDQSRLFGVGYTPQFNTPKPAERNIDIFLSAQDTHVRRHECFAALANTKGKRMVERTEGFTQGMEPDEYALWMRSAKVAPAPSGPASPDSFRAYEALQAHTVPIVDDITPGYDSEGYWRTVHPDAPFPILTSYEQLPGYTEDVLAGWPTNCNRITAWFMRYKRQLALNLIDDLTELGAL